MEESNYTCSKCGSHKFRYINKGKRQPKSRVCVICFTDKERLRSKRRAEKGYLVTCYLCGETRLLKTISSRHKLCLECWRRKDKTGKNSSKWKGGKILDRSTGYVNIKCSDGKYRGEHRIIMEQLLGRELFTNENVHHKNGIRNDNRPENLELWITNQPTGSRIEDLLEWAKYILETYGVYKWS